MENVPIIDTFDKFTDAEVSQLRDRLASIDFEGPAD